MPYIGKNPVGGGFHKLDNLTASATDTYALTLGSAAYYPESANQLLVSLNGVIQAPQDSFTVSGSDLVFDDPLTASDSIDFVVALGDVLAVQTVTDGAITTAKLGNSAVTSAKLDTNIAVSGNLDVGTIRDAAGTNTAMTIDSTGRILTPARPAFSVSGLGSNFTIISGSETKVPFQGTPTVNVGNHYSNGTFTPPVAGLYWIHAYALILLSGGNNATLQIKRSGVSVIEGRTKNTSENQVSVAGVVSCSVGDTIEIFAGCDSSNSLLYSGYNVFNGYLIG